MTFDKRTIVHSIFVVVFNLITCYPISQVFSPSSSIEAYNSSSDRLQDVRYQIPASSHDHGSNDRRGGMTGHARMLGYELTVR